MASSIVVSSSCCATHSTIIHRTNSRLLFAPQSPSLSLPSLNLRRIQPLLRTQRVPKPLRAVEEEVVSTEEVKEDEPTASVVEEQPVSVPVSPSDVLTMFFKADGTMSESAVPTVTTALEEVEGVGDLKVQVVEGIASVECAQDLTTLTKQTTVQATGVASNLVEIIQGSGFKLQALNLSFDDEEDAVN